MTNILDLPLVEVTVLTGNNEDWIENIDYLDEDGNPLSLHGISLSMMVRRTADDHEVILEATTANNYLMDGGTNDGQLIISIPKDVMKAVEAGDYVGDLVGTADGYSRVLLRLTTITVFQGITR